MKGKLTLLLAMFFAAWLPMQALASDVTKLDWIDLVPESERKLFDSIGMPASDHTGTAATQSKIGSVRPELNNTKSENSRLCDSPGRRCQQGHGVSTGALLWRLYPRATTTAKPNHLCEIS